ncbi:MAG: hypothetical protein GTO49_07505 [Anaerolineae bacterium]|nr:hypothetical protein [Anaerolineae bacterium]
MPAHLDESKMGEAIERRVLLQAVAAIGYLEYEPDRVAEGLMESIVLRAILLRDHARLVGESTAVWVQR